MSCGVRSLRETVPTIFVHWEWVTVLYNPRLLALPSSYANCVVMLSNPVFVSLNFFLYLPNQCATQIWWKKSFMIQWTLWQQEKAWGWIPHLRKLTRWDELKKMMENAMKYMQNFGLLTTEVRNKHGNSISIQWHEYSWINNLKIKLAPFLIY